MSTIAAVTSPIKDDGLFGRVIDLFGKKVLKTTNPLSPIKKESKVADKKSEVKSTTPKKRKSKNTELKKSKLKFDMSKHITTEEYEEYLKKIQSVLSDDKKFISDNKSLRVSKTFNFIQKGIYLRDAKSELVDNEWKLLCKTIPYSQRQIDRDIEFVTTDSRIDKITELQLGSLKNPSKTKLIKMKDLSNSEFSKVLSGNDEKYKVLLRKQKSQKNSDLVSPHKNISDDEYRDFKSQTIDYMINLLSDEKTESQKMLKTEKEKVTKIRKELRELKSKSPKPSNNTLKPKSPKVA